MKSGASSRKPQSFRGKKVSQRRGLREKPFPPLTATLVRKELHFDLLQMFLSKQIILCGVNTERTFPPGCYFMDRRVYGSGQIRDTLKDKTGIFWTCCGKLYIFMDRRLRGRHRHHDDNHWTAALKH